MQNLKMFVAWWKFTKPNKWVYFTVMATIFVHRCCLVAAPIFAAKVITSLASGDHSSAVLFLSIVLGLLVFRNIVMHLNYYLYTTLIKQPYLSIQSKIADKVLSANPQVFKNMSKDKFINVLHTDTISIVDVLDLTATKIGSLMQVIMTIFAVLFLNIYVALILGAVCVVNYFILNALHTRHTKWDAQIRSSIDDEYEAFSNLYEAKDTIIFDEGKDYLREQLDLAGKKYLKAKHKHVCTNSFLKNWFFVFYNIVVFVITLGLISLIAKGDLTFEMYLIIVPYLLLVIESCNDFFDMFKDVKNGNMRINRVQKLLSLPDKEANKFGDSEIELSPMGIDFVDVSVTGNELPSIHNATFCLRRNEVTLIHGPKGCGKRTIFHLLAREVRPDNGKILVGEMDIYNYSKIYYQKKLNIVAKKPFMFSGSIMSNLKAFEKNDKKIFEVCIDLGIHDNINVLPDGYDTHVSEVYDYLKHMLEFARCILSGCEVIMFYETPETLTKFEKENLRKQIEKYGKRKSIVIFSSSLEWAKISHKVIKFQEGEISEIQRNRKN